MKQQPTLAQEGVLLALLEAGATPGSQRYTELAGVELRVAQKLRERGWAVVRPIRRFQLTEHGYVVARQIPTPAEG